jgi:hypothetical protein
VGRNGRPEDQEERVASLEARVHELLGAVRTLTAEVEQLRAAGSPRAAAPVRGSASVTPDEAVEVTPEEGAPTGGAAIGRRRLLLGGGAAAAAATAAVVASTGSPAAAANGGALIMGVDTNTSTARTKWQPTTAEGTPGLWIDQQGAGDALRVSAGSTIAVIGEASDGVGLYGQSDSGTGIVGTSPVVGVAGVGGAGTGVSGNATSGVGVQGTSESGVGVLGRSLDVKAGVRGIGDGNLGVWGTGKFLGVFGESEDTGVVGEGRIGLDSYATDVHLRMGSPTPRAAPTGDTTPHQRGDLVRDDVGDLWACVAEGTPGTWRKLAGPASAGTFHLLANPVRVYDSRPGTTPAVGSKTKLSGNTARLLSVTANSSGVPLGATAVAVTLLLVNASSAGGNFTIWAGGAPRPSANAMVWGGTAGRFASTATTRISATGTVNVAASSSTDLALDIVGYYR